MSLILANSNRERFNSLVSQINDRSAGRTWSGKLHATFDFSFNKSLKRKAGTFYDPTDANFHNYTSHPRKKRKDMEVPRLLQTLPSSLDLRMKFPHCSSISTIRDQGNCSSCWAVAAMNTLSDRYCIQKSNESSILQREFSYQDILECCPHSVCGSKGNGCLGGKANGAFTYTQSIGVVTGGGFGNTTMCKSYFLSPAVQTQAVVPICNLNCTNNTVYKTSYSEDRIKILGFQQIFDPNVTNTALLTMNILNTMGTVQAFMLVYEDFFTYSSGIYYHVNGNYVGGHIIRIIGYGTTNGVDYWLCANSWGENWGTNGFFMIKRGVNESMIEGYLLNVNL